MGHAFSCKAPKNRIATDRKSSQFNTKNKGTVAGGGTYLSNAANHYSNKCKGGYAETRDRWKNTYDFYMENTGETMLQCKAHLALTNIETGKEFKLDKTEFPVFPEGKRTVRLVIPATVPKGKYSGTCYIWILVKMLRWKL